MKKIVSLGLAVALVAIFVTGAVAFGPGSGMGMGPCYGTGSAVAPEQAQKFAQFQKDVLPLRQQMLALRTDLMTLRSQSTPDWKAIAEKQKQMVDVRTEIMKKATEAGFKDFGQGRCGCAGMGMRGMGMQGPGMGRMGM